MNYNGLHVIHELTDYYFKNDIINAGHIGTNAFYAEIDLGMKFSGKENNLVYILLR